eukprot:gene419-47046_t
MGPALRGGDSSPQVAGEGVARRRGATAAARRKRQEGAMALHGEGLRGQWGCLLHARWGAPILIRIAQATRGRRGRVVCGDSERPAAGSRRYAQFSVTTTGRWSDSEH